MAAGSDKRSERWTGRPWVARTVRVVAFLLPFATSVLFVWLASRVIHVPETLAGFVLWWILLSAAGSLVMWLVDRGARRLLPLAALLQLSLVFPDQAPSRFRAALESGRVGVLEDRLALAQRAAQAETPAESARLLLTLVAALSDHDRLTRGHSERVRGYAVMIGRELGLSDAEIDQLNWAALLHDIGKLEVPTEILNKPGRPDEDEWQQLKRHPLYGERFVEPMRPWLGPWADAVGYHHERWDGKGYPRGTEGEDIPLAGRIVAIADVFDVITSARSYKDAGSPTAGREEIARCAGSQFDPKLVRAFLAVSLGRLRLVMGPLSWLAHLPVIGRLPIGSVAGTVWGAAGVLAATVATGLAATGGAHHATPAGVAGHPATAQRPAAERAMRARRHRRAVAHPRARAARAVPPPSRALTLRPLTATPARRPAPTPAPTPAPAVSEGSGFGAMPDLPAVLPSPGAPAPTSPAPRVPTVPAPAPPVPNRPPSFVSGADTTVDEDAGPQAFAGWATAIDPGAFESAQTVTFAAASDHPALFAEPPAISRTGTLTFTPAPDANGRTTVTVRASDDGGTADGGADTSAPQTFTITIRPVNDAPTFATGADQASDEDAGPQTVPAWATAISPGPGDEAGQAVTLTAVTDHPELFSAAPALDPDGTLHYTPAPDANGTATVTVRAHDDGGTAHGGSDTSAPQTFTITIAPVDDPPSFAAGAAQTANEDAGTQTVPGWATTISPGPANEAGEHVTFVTGNDDNALFGVQPAVSATGTLTYTPAPDANGTATVTVRAHDDGGTTHGGSDTSAPQTFTITITPVNDPPSFTKGADQTVAEDAGAQSVSGWATTISPGPSDEAGQHVAFTATNDDAALFSVQPAVSATGTLTYTPAPDANGTATVTVRAHDDGGTTHGGSDTSAPQTFTITITPVNDPPSFTKGADQSGYQDDPAQSVGGWATDISPGPANEAGQSVTFLVTDDNTALFSAQPAVSPSGTLTYTPAPGASGVATVTVRAHDSGGTAGGGSDTSAPQTFTITLVAPNHAPSFTAGASQTANEDAGAQSVGGWATNISPGPASESGQQVTFLVSADDPSRFSAQPAVSPSGTLTYTPAPNANGIATITVRAHDDGGTAHGGSDTSAAQTFTLTLRAVNDPPSFTKGADQSVAQDSGAASVGGWATTISPGPADESGQSVSFTTSADQPSLFAAQPQVAANGTLTFTPASGASGTATVTVRAVDGGGTANGGSDTSAPQTFTITIRSINHAPSFSAGGNQSVLEDSGAQTVSGWATNISPGPAGESGQHVSFLVDNPMAALFAAGPSIAADGTLTYTPAANANGTATITVRAHDDGGTADGGSDTSAGQSFTIAIGAVNDRPSFTAGPNQSTSAHAGAVTVPNWATNISPGPSDENGQRVSFTVSVDDPSLFRNQPAVASDGTLTYRPNGHFGTATVTVRAVDDGGTGNGGNDTSAPQTFAIDIGL